MPIFDGSIYIALVVVCHRPPRNAGTWMTPVPPTRLPLAPAPKPKNCASAVSGPLLPWPFIMRRRISAAASAESCAAPVFSDASDAFARRAAATAMAPPSALADCRVAGAAEASTARAVRCKIDMAPPRRRGSRPFA
jgi:hypothetical protein